jgi:hypothetical protein
LFTRTIIVPEKMHSEPKTLNVSIFTPRSKYCKTDEIIMSEVLAIATCSKEEMSN